MRGSTSFANSATSCNATIIKFLSIVIAGVIAYAGFGIIIGGAVGAGIYAYGQGIAKFRDVACPKCKWKEAFLVVRKFGR